MIASQNKQMQKMNIEIEHLKDQKLQGASDIYSESKFKRLEFDFGQLKMQIQTVMNENVRDAKYQSDQAMVKVQHLQNQLRDELFGALMQLDKASVERDKVIKTSILNAVQQQIQGDLASLEDDGVGTGVLGSGREQQYHPLDLPTALSLRSAQIQMNIN